MSKIFVSYKYSDCLVEKIPGCFNTTARNYVDIIEKVLSTTNHIYKGEKDNESLEDFKDETIQTKLSNKIFDSSVTIVLISPGMKDNQKKESDQWIPWEVSYSLRKKSRGGKTSNANAMLAVILPDVNGKYDYWTRPLFSIIKNNISNIKDSYKGLVSENEHSYILPVYWYCFLEYFEYYIQKAKSINSNSYMYDIKVSVNDLAN